VYFSMLQCAAVRCSALQCVAVCCNALQYAGSCAWKEQTKEGGEKGKNKKLNQKKSRM